MKKNILFFCSILLFSFSATAQDVWDGSTSTDWSVDSNWADGSSPESFFGAGVTIPNVANDPVITSLDVTGVGNITIATGATLTISSDATLNHPSGVLDNDGIVILNSGASYVQSASVTGDGTFRYIRNLDTSNWYVVSSPVAGQDIDAFVSASSLQTSGSNSALGTYLTPSNTYSYYVTGSSGTGNFIQGKGHTISLAGSSGDITFTGSNPTITDVNYTLTYSGDRYNLLGNIWPSYLKTASFLNDNTLKLESETVWLWNATNSSYTTYVGNLGPKIAPCQGFFVEGKSGGSGAVTFKESYQTTSGSSFAGPEIIVPEVHLKIKNSTTYRDTQLYFVEGTTTGFDNGWDGKIFGGQNNDFAIYTRFINDTNPELDLGVQSLPDISYEVPVGINAVPGSEITISATSLHLPIDINVYLEDRDNDTLTLLDDTSEYTISLPDGSDGIGRFYLHTVSNELEIGENNLENILIFKSSENNLRISGLHDGIANIKIYNMLGKQILETSFEANDTNNISLQSLQLGVYIVHLVTESGILIKKVIL